MNVSIIIVNYHSEDLVSDCIQSVIEKTKDLEYEIIVVDNDSKNESVQLLRERFGGRICVISSKENLGFGKANNLGVRYSSGEYVFLLNPDTILVNNAIKILMDYLKAHPDVGVVGGNLYSSIMSPAPSYSLQFDHWNQEKKLSSWSTILGGKIKDKFSIYKHVKAFEKSFNYSEQPMEVGYIFGADMMLKKSLFDKVHGFDPDFFMYGEEEELSWRICETGKKIVSVPEAQIIHLEGMTAKENDRFSERHFRMRMNGTMTYYHKVYGIEGISKFYEYRSRRYDRLITIAKIRKKNLLTFEPTICRNCLEDEYQKYMNKIGEK